MTELPPFSSQALSAWNTLGLSCHADRFVALTDTAQIPALARLRQEAGDFVLLGGGSNVVLPERLDQPVVAMRASGILPFRDAGDHVVVEALAGTLWHELVTHCVRAGVGGLENLALIPGTVGAAPVQNIGAYGVELQERFDTLQAYDLQEARWRTFDGAEARFAYRDSIFKQHPGRWVIGRVSLRLPRVWTAVLDYPDLKRTALSVAASPSPLHVYEAVCEIRRAKLPDPQVLGNAGSFFKNPVIGTAQFESLKQRYPGLVGYPTEQGVKLAAGWLIDQAGWKGRRLGPVGMHARQALVLVNHGGATARDVEALAKRVSEDVWARYAVRLEPEPVFIAGRAEALRP